MIRMAAAVAAALMASSTAIAGADPAVPQLDTRCDAILAGATTWPSGTRAPLECRGGGWQPAATPYPLSARWFSYGPAMKLYGEALRNPALGSGDWTATPLSPEDACRAEQFAAAPGGGVGPALVDEGDPGQPLSLQVVPLLFSIELSGTCLWQQVGG